MNREHDCNEDIDRFQEEFHPEDVRISLDMMQTWEMNFLPLKFIFIDQ